MLTLDQQHPDWTRINRCVSTFLKSYSLDVDDLEDLRQECLLQILRKLKTFRGEASLSTWIFRLVRNQFLMWNRRERRRREVLGVMVRCSGTAVAPPPDDLALNRAWAAKVLAGIEPLDQRILCLRYLEDHTSLETGRRLNLAPSTVRARTSHCRRRLRGQADAAV